MARTTLIITFAFINLFFACGTDNGNQPKEGKQVEDLRDITSELVDNKDSIAGESIYIADVGSDAKEHEAEKLMINKKKTELRKRKREFIKSKFEKSKYKGMTCEELINKYKEIINEYQKTKNVELLLWKDSNDPIYAHCYSLHRSVFDSLESIENSVETDEEQW